MIQRLPHGPCLGDRVGALADGTMPPDAATRALAHAMRCGACHDALELERLTIERLRSLPAPAPSGDLMASLLRLGEPGGPVPLRRGRVPGSVRPPTAAIAPPGGYAAAWAVGTAPGGSRRPHGRREVGRRRGLVTAAAGALGVGVLAVTAMGGAGVVSPRQPGPRAPVDQLRLDPQQAARIGGDRFAVDPGRSGGAVLKVSTHGTPGHRTDPAMVGSDSARGWGSVVQPAWAHPAAPVSAVLQVSGSLQR